jgi:hypothetical protein
MARDQETKRGEVGRVPALLFQGGLGSLVFAFVFGTGLAFMEERSPVEVATYYLALVGGGLAAVVGAVMAISQAIAKRRAR